MDNKRTLILVVAFGAFILLWMAGVSAIQRYMGWDPTARRDEPAQVEPDATAPDTDDLAGDAGDLPPPTLDAAADSEATPSPATRAADESGDLDPANLGEPRQIVLGSAEEDDERFALQVTLNTVGAGIDRVLLNQFRAEVDDPEPYVFEIPYSENPNRTRPLATRSVQLLGQTVRLNDVPWRVKSVSDKQAVFEIDIANNGETVATVTKEFRLFERTETIRDQVVPHGGYELLVRETITNRTGQTIAARTTIQGPTTPPRELEGGFDRTIVRGVLGSNGIRYEAEQVEGFNEDEPKQVYDLDEVPLVWAGTGTIYFNAILRPLQPNATEGEVETPDTLSQVVVEAVNPDSEPSDRHVALRFVSEPLEIAPGESEALSFAFFAGPKERSLLENAYYGGPAIGYDLTLQSPFGCTWCVFQPVVDVLVALLSFFHLIFRDWGLAIIALVCVVRLLLHPITKRSQKNLLRMGKLAPKIQAIKEKYGDDREKMAAAMAEIAPEQTQALLFGCLPMLLQTPIWIALYSSLQATFELRHEPFLYGWTWIDDLSQPDQLIDFGQRLTPFPEWVPLLSHFGLSGINILPILMGVVFFLQIKIQPQPTTAMSEDQKRQQKLMQTMMVAMFPLFLYSAPSGLNLYILTSTTIGIIESTVIRRNLKRQEEEEERLEAEYAKSGKKRPEPPKGPLAQRMAGFRERMAKRLEEAQREAAKRQQGRK